MIIILIILAGLGFGGYKLYKKIQNTELTQKQILQTQEEEKLAQAQKNQEIIQEQQNALNQAQTELTQTKSNAEKTNSQLKTISQTLQAQQSAPKDIIISSNDLSPYTTGVVQVICVMGNNISSGSGTLWNFNEVPNAVLTNYHVVKGADKCVLSITNSANVNIGLFNLDASIYSYNKSIDEAVLSITSPISGNTPISNYNFSLSKVRECSAVMPVGTPVVIIGYPAYAKRDTTMELGTIGTVNVIYRTVTNGIVSGYDTSAAGEANYFVSAKIDAGNSGGMAIAKDPKGLCLLGLPTWLTVGNYETQGLVQNIHNVLP
ncbi:MAG: hypothetical protein JWN37_355 [Candidatus Nomurabacteria bacterium]|nr:hypothetical protein [Candidatus Nomurabacteria bacterium]